MFGSRKTMPDDRGPCVCLECGMRVPGQRGVTCLEMNCPNCGAVLVRENSPYHEHVMRRWFRMDLDVALALRTLETDSPGERAPVGADEGRGVLAGASAS